MSAAATEPVETELRALELHARALSLDDQMGACIELLQHPEVVVESIVESVAQVRGDASSAVAATLVSGDGGERDPRRASFYPSRELFVQGDSCSFTCLGTELAFREGETSDEEADARRIDYAAVTCESRPFPVLGFVQAATGESAYPLLLRALSSLIELVRPKRFDLLDREVYRGLLGPAPSFDLSLVVWDDDLEADAQKPLCELSRDLTEVLKDALASEPRFPPILNTVVCLRMNPTRFDGRLRFVWRV